MHTDLHRVIRLPHVLQTVPHSRAIEGVGEKVWLSESSGWWEDCAERCLGSQRLCLSLGTKVSGDGEIPSQQELTKLVTVTWWLSLSLLAQTSRLLVPVGDCGVTAHTMSHSAAHPPRTHQNSN